MLETLLVALVILLVGMLIIRILPLDAGAQQIAYAILAVVIIIWLLRAVLPGALMIPTLYGGALALGLRGLMNG